MKRTILAIAALVAGSLAAPAQATVIPARGGSGDAHGEIRCPPGYVVVGFVGRTGSWIDKVAPMCAQVMPGYGTGGVVVPDGKGGNGGEAADRYCPRDMAVRDVKLYFSDRDGTAYPGQLTGIEFSCVRMRDGASGDRAIFGYLDAGYVPAAPVMVCPGQEYVTGVTIHYGRYVDALGLICGVVEIAAPPPPPPPAPPPTPSHHLGTGRCKTGFVWREARTGDHVCVTPGSRDLVASENAQADARRDPNGAYGPMTCISGFVWREAMAGDKVCVTPHRRDVVQAENAQDGDRKD